MDHVVFKEKSTLILSKELLSQISYFHNKAQNVEWSGLLFYKITKGSIADPKSLVLRAERMYLMDIGATTYTEFSPDATIMDFYDSYPICEEMKYGLIHTHHSMKTFFSGTDIDELETNAGSHNFYLSLIVNYDNGGQYTAKIAIIADVETETKYKFNNGVKLSGIDEDKPIKNSSKRLITIDCDIIYDVDSFDAERYNTLIKSKTQKREKLALGGKFPLFSEGFDREIEPYIPKTVNEIDGFLTKLFSLNMSENRSIKEVIEDLEVSYIANPAEFEAMYMDCVDGAIDDIYIQHFDEPLFMDHHNKFFRQCIMYLDKYRLSGYKVYDSLIEILEIYIDATPVEEKPIVDTKDKKKAPSKFKQLIMKL